MVRLVPADPQDTPGRLDGGVQQDINGKPFKQQGKPGMWFSPRQPDTTYTMPGTLHAWWSGMKKGLELTAVQMAPRSFFRMVMQVSGLSTFRAGPFLAPGMVNPDIYPLRTMIKFNTGNRLWLFRA